jgi:hypothetical protein
VKEIQSDNHKPLGVLLLLTAGALLVHGYHPYAEDAEIYLPGVEKILHPELFPGKQEFFASHASLTISESGCVFPAADSLAYGGRAVSMASGVYFSAAAGVLGVEPRSLFKFDAVR